MVNATSIGRFPDVDALIPLDLATSRPGMIVSVVIPIPSRTRLIRIRNAGQHG